MNFLSFSVYPSLYLELESNAGAVKITPGHDVNDWEVGQRLELPVVDMFTDAGRVARDASISCSSREALDAEPFRAMLSDLAGAHRFEARAQVLECLRASGALRGERAHAHKLPLCSRTGDVVEWRAREQWFLDCSALAAEAARAPLEFEPPSRANEWREWLTRQRSHSWCLSRQLWWGHQIPAYKATPTDASSTVRIDRSIARCSSSLELHSYKETSSFVSHC